MIFHCFFPPLPSCFSLFCLSSNPNLSLNIFLFLSVCLLQCDQVQVIPIPSVCIIIFHFFLHLITLYLPHPWLALLIIRAACGHWHKGDVSLCSNEILHSIFSGNHAAFSALLYPQMANAHTWYGWVHFRCSTFLLKKKYCKVKRIITSTFTKVWIMFTST